jgi:FMN phosphatase YigB (HAD superfamily)
MPITLLLDLDDTLLDTHTEVFLSAYYAALADHLCDQVAPDVMLAALRSGVQRMILNQDPRRTLQQVFEAEFYPRLGVDPNLLREKIAGFYRTVFPTLGRTTQKSQGARELIDWASSAGHVLALATDPVFPWAATAGRVRWAGLDPARFEIISSFESFHFTKTHPAYYAEVLGRLGWPDLPVLMAGNDVERDLRPAERLGLTTFHVNGGGDNTGGRSGDLLQLRDWILTNEDKIRAPSFDAPEAVLSVLEATPAVLQSLTANLTPAQWAHEASADDWAMIELVCHLRDTEREVHAEQITALVGAAAPFIARPDAAVWAKQRQYRSEDGPASAQQFAAARLSGLARLRSLPDHVWAKPARHAIFGPTNFLEVIGFMAEHDRLHLQQAWRTLHAQTEPAHRK